MSDEKPLTLVKDGDVEEAEIVSGPKGRVPRAKLRDGDNGNIQIKIGSDPESKTVVLDFGTPIAWIGFSADDARDIAKVFVNLANGLDNL